MSLFGSLRELKTRRFFWSLIVLAMAGALAAISIFAGFVVARHDLWPSGLLARVEGRLFGEALQDMSMRRESAEWADSFKTVKSIFVTFRTDIGFVPVARSGAGGGLASFGDDVLVLAHDGEIFAARSGANIKKTDIETPDNGFDAYREAAQAPGQRDMPHQPDLLRFNDILRYRSETESGLAVSYTEFDREKLCFHNTVAILPIDPSIIEVSQITAKREDWKILFRTQPCLPFKQIYRPLEGHLVGGRMAFKAPATIYVTSGDFGWDGIYAPEAISQYPDYDYGKVIELDLVSGASRHVSTGNRNEQGIAIDRDGRLWVAEHGHRGGDELNLIKDGANYGWPIVSLGTRYNGMPLPHVQALGRHTGYEEPTYAWLPSVAPSNLILINGVHEAWDGDLLMGSLRDESLYRIRIRGDAVQFAERMPIGRRIRYVHEHTDRRLVLWTDDHALVFLTPGNVDLGSEFIEQYLAASPLPKRRLARLEAAIGVCAECHTFDGEGNADAAALGLVYGGRIAGSSYGQYSDAMRARGGQWTRAALEAYLADPQAYLPGTTMPDPGIDDPETLEDLANLLEALRVGEGSVLPRTNGASSK